MGGRRRCTGSYNPIQIPRIDIMEHYDAIFTELGADAGPRTRLVSAMALLKPATLWVTHAPSAATFAFALLHGVYPMAPAPSGDHSIGLSGMAAYLTYGPMLRALQGRVWNLEPHAVSATVAAEPSQHGERDVSNPEPRAVSATLMRYSPCYPPLPFSHTPAQDRHPKLPSLRP